MSQIVEVGRHDVVLQTVHVCTCMDANSSLVCAFTVAAFSGSMSDVHGCSDCLQLALLPVNEITTQLPSGVASVPICKCDFPTCVMCVPLATIALHYH